MAKQTYAPLILNHPAMLEKTAHSLGCLMDSSRQKPVIAARLYLDSHQDYDMAANRILLGGSNGWEVGPLHMYQDLFNETLLARALYAVNIDPFIGHLLLDLPQLAALDIERHGFIEMFIMPGVVRLAYPVPMEIAPDCAGRFAEDPRDPYLMNLGVFISDRWSSSHEAMQAASKVHRVKPIWNGFHVAFNHDAYRREQNIRLSDPLVCPETETAAP